jgi:predicted HicB family RNase H-like nuclease
LKCNAKSITIYPRGDIMTSPKNLNVRMTEEEYKKVVEDANNCGLSLSDYVRLLIRKAEIKVEIKSQK